eukprot:11139_5
MRELLQWAGCWTWADIFLRAPQFLFEGLCHFTRVSLFRLSTSPALVFESYAIADTLFVHRVHRGCRTMQIGLCSHSSFLLV